MVRYNHHLLYTYSGHSNCLNQYDNYVRHPGRLYSTGSIVTWTRGVSSTGIKVSITVLWAYINLPHTWDILSHRCDPNTVAMCLSTVVCFFPTFLTTLPHYNVEWFTDSYYIELPLIFPFVTQHSTFYLLFTSPTHLPCRFDVCVSGWFTKDSVITFISNTL